MKSKHCKIEKLMIDHNLPECDRDDIRKFLQFLEIRKTKDMKLLTTEMKEFLCPKDKNG